MDDIKIEQVVIENLINSEEYFRQVIPHLKEEYFSDRVEKVLIKMIQEFADKHNKSPTQKILSLMIKEYKGFSQDEYDDAKVYVNSLEGREENVKWLLERTEQLCRDKSVYNAIMQAVNIIDGNDDKFTSDAIPSILQDALAVSFDKSVGSSHFDDVEARYDYYHESTNKIPFRVDILNKITKGGLPNKTISLIVASSGVGKSALMCSLASDNIILGKSVLYVTCEMSEVEISKRIDCSLMDVALDELMYMKRDKFISNIADIKAKTHGRLVVKEYPTSVASTNHITALLEELKTKQKFVPDIIYVDYLNLLSSSRYKGGNTQNSYTIYKAVCEELRSIGIIYDVPIVTCTQTNRTGSVSSDIDVSHIAESHGVLAGCDLVIAISRTDELDKIGQIIVKQLKNRYHNVDYYRKFVLGADIAKFHFYDVEEKLQGQLDDCGMTDSSMKLLSSTSTHDVNEINFD